MILSRKQVRILLPLGEQYNQRDMRSTHRLDHERTLQAARHFLTTPAIAYNFDGRQCRWMREWIARSGRHGVDGIERALFYHLESENY